MRRISLLLGALGAIGGCLVSLWLAVTTYESRTEAQEFSRLSSGPIVIQEVAHVKAVASDQKPSEASATKNTAAVKLPKGFKLDATPLTVIGSEPLPDTLPADFFMSHTQEAAQAALAGGYKGWEVKHDGIEKIYFSSVGQDVNRIDMEGGGFWSSTQAASRLWYLLVPVFPFVGFMVPWGIMKILIWVGSGFAKEAK